jgi:hypothetical protein
MKLRNFFTELTRRNVYKVASVHALIARLGRFLSAKG